MRKFFCFALCLILFFTCSCSNKKESSDTRILMNTVVTITADCSMEIIDQAFDLCATLENKLSRTKENSDIWAINNSDTFVPVSNETIMLINKARYYSEKTNGKFDVTVYPVSSLYDFTSKKLPSNEKIAAALPLVDYKKIEVKGNSVCLKEGGIDFGGIAKGYIADCVVVFLKEKGVKSAIVNIGGNLYCFGKNEYKIGIKKPFENGIIATVKGKEGAFVTSGIYERYIKENDKIYHHIIDPATGYGVENDLAGVTVMCSSSADADALSTACMLLGGSDGIKLIDSCENTEAVLVKRDGSILLSNGLIMKNGYIVYK